MKSFIVALFFALCASIASAQCPNCKPPVVYLPKTTYQPYYAVPYAATPRGAYLQQKRAGAAFRWLPGDAFRGRGVMYVPAK